MPAHTACGTLAEAALTVTAIAIARSPRVASATPATAALVTALGTTLRTSLIASRRTALVSAVLPPLVTAVIAAKIAPITRAGFPGTRRRIGVRLIGSAPAAAGTRVEAGHALFDAVFCLDFGQHPLFDQELIAFRVGGFELFRQQALNCVVHQHP